MKLDLGTKKELKKEKKTLYNTHFSSLLAEVLWLEIKTISGRMKHKNKRTTSFLMCFARLGNLLTLPHSVIHLKIILF